MTNVNAAFGLRPTRSLGRSNTQINEYAHTTESTAAFIGDSVVTSGTSTSAITGLPDGTPYVTVSGTTTTTAIRGAIVGVRPTLTNLTLQYAPASTAIGLLICDDPNQLFEIQSDGTVVVGDVSADVSIVTGSGSTVTGLSGYQAHESDVAGGTYVLHIVRVKPTVGNALGANAILECRVNLHELAGTGRAGT